MHEGSYVFNWIERMSTCDVEKRLLKFKERKLRSPIHYCSFTCTADAVTGSLSVHTCTHERNFYNWRPVNLPWMDLPISGTDIDSYSSVVGTAHS